MGYKLAVGGSPLTQGALVVGALIPPAPGADFSYTVPANIMIQPLAISFRLTTDGTAGDRYLALLITFLAGQMRFGFAQNAHTASLTQYYTFAAGGDQYSYTAGTGRRFHVIPDWLVLVPGETIGLEVNGIKAGDQFVDMDMARRQYIVPG